MAKTAIEKLNEDKQPEIKTKLPTGALAWVNGDPNGTMVISTPKEIDGILQRVPKGKVTTITEVRAHLAKKYKTTIACPVTTGIFMNISAHAAAEMLAQGRKRVTPYWRALKAGGELNDKFPGGAAAQRAKLEAEGFQVVARGKRLFVDQYQRHLAAL
jgi:hypothetical protein